MICDAGILSVEELPASVHVLEDVYSYPWHIDTKYYTADVLLCTTADRTIGDESFADAVQAFVIMFDSKKVGYISLFTLILVPYDDISVHSFYCTFLLCAGRQEP